MASKRIEMPDATNGYSQSHVKRRNQEAHDYNTRGSEKPPFRFNNHRLHRKIPEKFMSDDIINKPNTADIIGVLITTLMNLFPERKENITAELSNQSRCLQNVQISHSGNKITKSLRPGARPTQPLESRTAPRTIKFPWCCSYRSQYYSMQFLPASSSSLGSPLHRSRRLRPFKKHHNLFIL